MAHISPWQYSVTTSGTTANSNLITNYSGTFTVTPEYYAPTYARKSLSWQGSDMDVIDALFALKPKLKKKYKGVRDSFRKDLIAAAEHRKALDATIKLDDLLSFED